MKVDQFEPDSNRVEITNRLGIKLTVLEYPDGTFVLLAGPGRSFSFSPDSPGSVVVEIKS